MAGLLGFIQRRMQAGARAGPGPLARVVAAMRGMPRAAGATATGAGGAGTLVARPAPGSSSGGEDTAGTGGEEEEESEEWEEADEAGVGLGAEHGMEEEDGDEALEDDPVHGAPGPAYGGLVAGQLPDDYYDMDSGGDGEEGGEEDEEG